MIKQTFVIFLLSFFILTNHLAISSSRVKFSSNWHEYSNTIRIWIGPHYWANRMEDWQLQGGRLECTQDDTHFMNRTLHIISCELNKKKEVFELEVRTGLLNQGTPEIESSWTGFLIGAGHGEVPYKSASLVHHCPGKGGGLIAGFDDSGKLIFRSNEMELPNDSFPLIKNMFWDEKSFLSGRRSDNWQDIKLKLVAAPITNNMYSLKLKAYDHHSGQLLSEASIDSFPEARLRGNIALVSHPGKGNSGNTYWFKDLKVSGEKISCHPERTFGPILQTMYTFAENTLKLTAQFPPLGFSDERSAQLYIKRSGKNEWKLADERQIESPGFIARFRVENWQSEFDSRYEVRYSFEDSVYAYQGIITSDPETKDSIVVAAFSCTQVMGRPADDGWGAYFAGRAEGRWTKENLWFPHTEVNRNIPLHGTDLLFFSGDQIYEGGSPTNSYHNSRFPQLDYLYKWFLFCWDYGTITRNIPTIMIVDDHDIYQGDLWGDGGTLSRTGYNKQGGYLHEPSFINMVQQINCSHNPDPVNPGPVKNGITNYYGHMKFGGIDFAFLEDRKFKSLPGIVPGREMRGSKIINPEFDPESADIPGASLLGEEQMSFLNSWVNDWEDVYMKVALTQTVFASLNTGPNGEIMMDMDLNGWPQTPRDEALEILRRGHAFIISGDIHLATVVQYGIDDWGDASYNYSVTSLSNKYRRWWTPGIPGKNRISGMPRYTGEYFDAFNNKLTVYAAGNPNISNNEVSRMNGGADVYASEHLFLDRNITKDGYGIIVLNKKEQTIRMECLPWNADIQDTAQYEGWPVCIEVKDNYNRKAEAWLPALDISGIDLPVIKVIKEETGNLIYARRVNASFFQPKVFEKGKYTIIIGEPGTKKIKSLQGLKTYKNPDQKIIKVKFD